MTPVLEEAWRLHRAGDHGRAVALYRQCLAAEPENFEALFKLGLLYGQNHRYQEAHAMFAVAVQVDPESTDALFMHAYVLSRIGRAEEAVAFYGRALERDPARPEFLLNRGAQLFRLRRYAEAAEDYTRLLARNPSYPYARGNRLFSRLWCCDWRDLAEDRAAILDGVRAGRKIVAPFDGKLLPLAPAHDLAAARLWLADEPAPAPLWRGEIYTHEKIRIAYVSAHFHEHAVAAALSGVIAAHDKTRFEILAISLGPDDGSVLREKLRTDFDEFLDARALGDADVAALIRGREIDIAVDLMGYTEGSRPGILRHRPAPVQVNYLGYPGTMGADHTDYIVADSTVIPEAGRPAYAERVVTLPASFMPCPPRALSTSPTRAEAGLPERGFVFAAFHAAYKIMPEMFALWLRLVAHIEDSVLWLAAANDSARANLAAEAVKCGADPARLVFAPFLASAEDHLARLALADLFLDASPYNAHVTGTDALRAGVPVITLLGEGFAGRVGASLLHAAGLPELVTQTEAAYEALALDLARDTRKRAAVRARLAGARHTAALFDPARHTRNLERAFTIMQARARAGKPPQAFAVTDARS